MIFEHSFGNNFCATFFLIATLFFILSLYCYGFCANTTFSNYDCQISCHQIGCSNNTPFLFNFLFKFLDDCEFQFFFSGYVDEYV